MVISGQYQSNPAQLENTDRKTSKKRRWHSSNLGKAHTSREAIRRGHHEVYPPITSAINDFNAGSKLEITLIYFSRAGEVRSSTYPAYIKHAEGKDFSFNIVMEAMPEVGGVMFKESYGLHRQLFLKNESATIEVAENSVSNFTTRYPYKPQVLKGNFGNLKNLTASEYNNSFQRIMVSVADTDFIRPAAIVRSVAQLVCDKEAFNAHDSLMGPRFRMGISYIDMQIEGHRYHIYELKDSCLVIDSLQIQDHELRGMAYCTACH
jgi:hypothetical protein